MKDITAHGRATTASSLPQPPSREQMPLCARCAREGGITRHGERYPPEKAHIHPNHVGVEREKSTGDGKITRYVHKGPREPLCSFHVELVAWEQVGQASGYPAPIWTREARGRSDVGQVIQNLERSLRSPTAGMRGPTSQRAPTNEQDEITRLGATKTLEREPGQEG